MPNRGGLFSGVPAGLTNSFLLAHYPGRVRKIGEPRPGLFSIVPAGLKRLRHTLLLDRDARPWFVRTSSSGFLQHRAKTRTLPGAKKHRRQIGLKILPEMVRAAIDKVAGSRHGELLRVTWRLWRASKMGRNSCLYRRASAHCSIAIFNFSSPGN